MGVKTSASEKDIKTAYFLLAKKYHPDLNPDLSARAQFEKVQKAYETLSDSYKRSEYDNKNGFARMEGSFQDFHERRKAVFSDDEEEYKDIN